MASCSPPKMAVVNKLGGVAHTIASSASESARVKFAPKRQSVSRGSAEYSWNGPPVIVTVVPPPGQARHAVR